MQHLADLGTPSAPPIVDMGREEKGFEVVGQNRRASDGLIESDLPVKGICPKDVCNGRDGLKECRAQSLETNEFGGRYCRCQPHLTILTL